MAELDMTTGMVKDEPAVAKPEEKKPEVKVEPVPEVKPESKPEVAKPEINKDESKQSNSKSAVSVTDTKSKVQPEKKPIKQEPIVPKTEQAIKMFGIWPMDKLKVSDPGLKDYISVKPVIVPRSGGRHGKRQFYKSKISLVERLMNHMFVNGHRGKRHLLTSGDRAGKVSANWKTMKEMLTILEKRAKINPLQVLIIAVENAALREEVTSFQVGGIMARKAVIASPQRRIDLALRLISQTVSKKAHANPKSIGECLADEIFACYEKDGSRSVAIKEKERIEREATGAR